MPPGSTLRALTRGRSMRESSQQQRRAVRGTVREKRDRQPVMRSLRRNHGRHYLTSPAREIRETVRSTVDRQRSPGNRRPAERKPPPNAVRASPERSDTRAPVKPPQAEPSPRAKRAVGKAGGSL